MPAKLIEGVYAALLTPRDEGGRLDELAFVRLLEFLLARGINGFAVNGATGELSLTTAAELERLAALTAKIIGPSRQFVCGIGATGIHLSCHLAEIAARHGAAALLLPPPYFFRYEQQDLDAFYCSAAASTALPLLLYNLPRFTTPIEPSTAVHLLSTQPDLVGTKDSSGSLETLRALSQHCPGTCRVVGSDAVLGNAHKEGLCDAVISGVACVAPELVTRVFYSSDHCAVDLKRLERLVEQLDQFPTPWALKWIGEALGLGAAHFAQPLSAARRQQGRKLQDWFRVWSAETNKS